MFVFGIDLPLPEILFVLVLMMLAGLVFIIIQIMHMNKHMKVLEDTTLNVRKVEEEEESQVKRFEVDIQKLESSEADMFVTKIVPTVTKLQNYVAVELLKGRQPEEVKGAIVKRGVDPNLATTIVNGMIYYLQFFHKLPQRQTVQHIQTVGKIRM